MPLFSTVRMPLVLRRRLTQRFSVSTQNRCVCRFGRNRRRFLLLAWETRLPTPGLLPVTSQTRDIRTTFRYFSNLGSSWTSLPIPGRALYQPEGGITRSPGPLTGPRFRTQGNDGHLIAPLHSR